MVFVLIILELGYEVVPNMNLLLLLDLLSLGQVVICSPSSLLDSHCINLLLVFVGDDDPELVLLDLDFLDVALLAQLFLLELLVDSDDDLALPGDLVLQLKELVGSQPLHPQLYMENNQVDQEHQAGQVQ